MRELVAPPGDSPQRKREVPVGPAVLVGGTPSFARGEERPKCSERASYRQAALTRSGRPFERPSRRKRILLVSRPRGCHDRLATLLHDRVTLSCRCIDRIFLAGLGARICRLRLVARFLRGRGFPYPSSAALGKLGDAYVEVIHRFAEVNDIPIKGESKEEFARPT